MINMFIGVVRTKAVAVLLGPVGVGLMSLFQSIVDMMRSVTDLGLGFSSVKDVAQAQATGDENRMAATRQVLMRWVWFAALLGTLLTIVFARPLGRWAFGNTEHTAGICLLSFCVFMGTLAAGQRALLQGMRHVGDMARASVLGTFSGMVVFVVTFWLLGEKGIVPAMLLAALANLVYATFYARRIRLPKTRQSLADTWHKGRSMVVLGCYSMVVGVVGTLCTLTLKSLLGRWADMDTVGLYQSSWGITGMALSAVLSAMATDYYPRLCAVSHDNRTMARYVNEQLRVAILLSSVVVTTMLLLAPLVLHIFYSAKFVPAEGLLRWLLLGGFLKVLNYPLGYVSLSKGKSLWFMLVELLWYGLYFGLYCLLWPVFGLKGLGMAYLGAHIVYTAVLLVLARRLCGFRPEKKNLQLTAVSGLILAASFLVSAWLPSGWLRWLLSGVLVLGCGTLSLYELNRVWPLRTIAEKLRRRV